MDHNNYGSIIQILNSRKSLVNYHYPIKVIETNNGFSKHKSDKNKNKKKYHKHPKANKNKEDREDKYTHPLSFAKMERRCYCCVKLGHKYLDWRTKDKIPKDEWTINKAQQHV